MNGSDRVGSVPTTRMIIASSSTRFAKSAGADTFPPAEELHAIVHTPSLDAVVTTDPWSSSIENYITQQCESIRVFADRHAAMSGYCSRRDVILRLPSVIIPAVSAPMLMYFAAATESDAASTTGLCTVGGATYFAPTALILTAVFNIATNFFQYERRGFDHNQAMIKWTELRDSVMAELSKRREFRSDANAFMVNLNLRVMHLSSISPDLDNC